MTPGARLQAVLDIVAGADAERAAAVACRAYFHERRYAGARDRRFVTQRVFDLTRHRARLAWWIERVDPVATADARRRLIVDLALAHEATADDIARLFSGARHCPKPLAPAEETLARALAGLPLDHPDMPAATRLELPDWLEADLRRLWGDRLEIEMDALNRPAPLDLRVNTLKAERERALAALADDGIAAEPTPLSPVGLRVAGAARVTDSRAYRDGLVEVQDEGSQLIALIAGARPGMTVVDLCAGAGGKTLVLAAAMTVQGQVRGRLIACDVAAGRLARLSARLARAGAVGVEPCVLDATGGTDAIADLAADRLLVDAPCSGTGTWRREPGARWCLTPVQVENAVRVQARLLDDAARLVAPGGRIVYATCSLLATENERVVEAFLAARRGFAPVPAGTAWAESIAGRYPGDGPYLRLTPATTGTDGFFVAVLERRP